MQAQRDETQRECAVNWGAVVDKKWGMCGERRKEGGGDAVIIVLLLLCGKTARAPAR